MWFWVRLSAKGDAMRLRARTAGKDKDKEPFIINPNAMLAILPNPHAAEIVFYALDGQNFIMSFAPSSGDQVLLSIRRREKDYEAVSIFEARLSQADARYLWWRFCDGTIPLPAVLVTSTVPSRRRSLLFGALLLGLGLVFGGGAGWFFSGGSLASFERMASGPGEPALPASARPMPPTDSLGTPAPVAVPSVAAAPPVASSPALARGSVEDAAPVVEQSNSPAALLALRELRLALQEGRPISPELFRRLPEDVQRLLVSEGLVQASPERSSSAAAAEEPARLPTGAVLRAGSDPHGVPVVPRRLPSGVSDGALPPVGGGDLHGPRDFEAFGLRPGGR